jgi:hypothetical protein
MKFYTVCTLPHYHPFHVYRLKKQLQCFYDGDVELYCYTDRPAEFDADENINIIPITHTLCERQWYKIDFMGEGFVEGEDPIIAMDLDWTILSDITDMIDTPITPKQIIAIDRWWRTNPDSCDINGGMFKYYPHACRDIHEIFYSKPHFWQNAYRDLEDPSKVNGEQAFMRIHGSKSHEIIKFPGIRIGRLMVDSPEVNSMYADMYCKLFDQPYYTLGNNINPNIHMMHTQLLM